MSHLAMHVARCAPQCCDHAAPQLLWAVAVWSRRRPCVISAKLSSASCSLRRRQKHGKKHLWAVSSWMSFPQPNSARHHASRLDVTVSHSCQPGSLG